MCAANYWAVRRQGSDNNEKKVEFLNGVCVLCRMSAIREIGLLDEMMGGYVEDTDGLGELFRRAGFRSMHLLRALCITSPVTDTSITL